MSATSLRTHRCGELRAADIGSDVRLGGWVHRRRDLGGVVFLDLRDRDGLVQVAVGPERPEALAAAASLSSESVVMVRGVVAARPPGQANPEMATGEIEVRARELEVVGPAVPPAIPVSRAKGEELAAEELRLRHRHIDLRRPELLRNLVLRHRLLQRARAELSALGFLEVETPMLTKPTPEGARDYLVPSRVHPGEFYALPQSPQIYKQLLMVAGFDRYFQIARCFRDEDLRADRQPEFTQIDVEASFVTAEDIFAVAEAVLVALWAEAGHAVTAPFPRMPYREAMERYGTDKPDVRFGLEITDWTDYAVTFAARNPLFADLARSGQRVRGILAPGGSRLSRRDIDRLSEDARKAFGRGIAWLKRSAEGLTGSLAKTFDAESAAALGLAEGDAVLIAVGPPRETAPVLDRVRREVIRLLGIAPQTPHGFVWITEFPMFEREGGSGALVPLHHPFTSPHPDDVALLGSEPERVRSLHYDPVYNGVELGSGSIRIVDPALQSAVFDRLGLSPDEIAHRFGFLLEGLRAGAPPHGGIALGFDRIVMLLAPGAESLRDVIAFPKTTAARALFEGAPTKVRQEDLDLLHLRITP